MSQPGDIMIGVLLDLSTDKIYEKVTFNARPPKISCTEFSYVFLDPYHSLQALLFAAEEISQKHSILPNITLGFQVYKTCNIPHYEVQGALKFLAEPVKADYNPQCNSSLSFPAVIASSISSNSVSLANILGVSRYPQISPFSSLALLSDRKRFPSFFRTMTSDTFQSKGIAQLILHFGWTWVGLIASQDDYGLQGIQSIKKEIMKGGACVAFTEYILPSQPDLNVLNIIRSIKKSTVKVIVVFSLGGLFAPILNEMLKQNITGKMFIANAGWSRSNLLSTAHYFPVISGTLGFASKYYVVPGLSDFLKKIHPSRSTNDPWVKSYWEIIFNCRFVSDKNLTGTLGLSKVPCTGEENLDSVRGSSAYMNSLKYIGHSYAIVYVLAKALDDLNKCNLGKGPISQGSCANIWNFKPWQLTHYIKKVNLTLSYGEDIYFDDNGDPPATYSIVNWQMSPERSVKQVEIGSFRTSASQSLMVNSSQVFWPLGEPEVLRSVCSESCAIGFRRAPIQGQPSCCFECVPCLQGEISNQTESTNCFRCPWDQWPNDHKSGCVQKSVEFLAYEDALGAILATFSIVSAFIPVIILLLFISNNHTPIVKANNYSLSCLLLISLCLCFLCSLGFIGYPELEKCLLRQVSFGLFFTLCVACILAKTILVVLAFMATKPGSGLRKWSLLRVSYTIILVCFLLQLILSIIWLVLSPPFSQYNIETKPGIIIVNCNEGSPAAFWTMLGYLFLLASISFIVAFLARRLPDSFNEAQFITFSMVAFLSVWISFIPASLSAQGKYTVAMEIFAILASTWALVLCIFLPKCYIILLRPEINTKKYLRRKE
ncbi:extracellular calcium-sensing receptor-like [Hyperolius riggenbachi]|uniref:extracellular calcium-sensing receptor-like n=1 Tax=Hyperolius riggenbachi TaxID=752182 RepID=UPI0035A3AEFC